MRAQTLDLRTYRIIDLTHAFDDNTVYWPTSPSRFELKPLAFGKTPGGYFYASFVMCTPEHGGTHLDAPLHFAEGHPSIGEVALERLMGPAVVIDVSKQAAADPVYRVTPEDIAAFERDHGPIPAGAIVLLRTGWSRFWPDVKQYPRRRHARRRLEAAISGLRRRGRKAARRTETRRRARDRHRVDRLRTVH